jgi:VCBS repeat-containing protein
MSNTADLDSNGGDGGGLALIAGTAIISNSIIAGNLDTTTGAEDCVVVGGTAVSGGYNLFGDSTGCTFAISSDVSTSNPLLGPLADNGGETLTHRPLPFSPAIDLVPNAVCTLDEDQRGVTRPVDNACDSGAVELAINFAPVAAADMYTTTEETSLTVGASGVLTNDMDADWDELTAVLDNNVTNGSLSLNSNGSFVYNPDINFCGTDNFTYHANDGETDSNVVTVTLDVACVNDAPMAVADSYAVPKNTSMALDVLANDSDVDGDDLSVTAVTTPSNGTATISGTLVLYTPEIDFGGTDVFSYIISDGVLTDTAVVTIIVSDLNNPPTAVADAYTVDESSSDNVLDVLANDSDLDDDGLNIVAVSAPSKGTAVISGLTVLYTPTPGFVGSDNFSYTISDGTTTMSATVEITVQPANTSYSLYLPAMLKP